MGSPFDLRLDLAVQAAKELDAKIEKAVEAAFDDGMDFVISDSINYDGGDYFNPRPLHEPVVHTISHRGGPIAPDEETPPKWVRYARPKKWMRGQKLR